MSELDEIIIKLELLSGGIADAVEHQMRTETKRIQADAKRLTPGNTGYLRESITTCVERDAQGGVVGTVGTAVEYAPYVEFGTGPVGAESQKLLPEGMTLEYRKDGWVYYDERSGEFRYTKGQPAKPFLYPAFKQNEAVVRENIRKAVRKAQKGDGDG